MTEVPKFTPEEDADPADFRGQIYDETEEYEDDFLTQQRAVELIKSSAPGFLRDYDISVCDIDFGGRMPVVVLRRKDNPRKIYPMGFFEYELDPARIGKAVEKNIRLRDDFFGTEEAA